ncbi:MAG: hypothetical protein MI867_15895 [Pseudomonadales bacterium]|nr:hypothetical protein [Pseudomonadales bacterium]
MRLQQLLIQLMVVMLVSACAQTGTNQNRYSYQDIPGKNPRITFVRNQNQFGSTVVTSISINDWIIGTLAPGEHLTLEYRPGIHQVSVKGVTVPMALKKDREYFFLIEQNDNGSVSGIRRIYAKDAAQYMESGIYHTGR